MALMQQDSDPLFSSRNQQVPPPSFEAQRMVGESPVMRAVNAYIEKLASVDSTVLITGDTGTGKELVADLIHCHSPRWRQPLVCLNCAALLDGLVESELFGYERGAFTGASWSDFWSKADSDYRLGTGRSHFGFSAGAPIRKGRCREGGAALPARQPGGEAIGGCSPGAVCGGPSQARNQPSISGTGHCCHLAPSRNHRAQDDPGTWARTASGIQQG
jgi:hypothetical protein